jgi:hypothetical protein
MQFFKRLCRFVHVYAQNCTFVQVREGNYNSYYCVNYCTYGNSKGQAKNKAMTEKVKFEK